MKEWWKNTIFYQIYMPGFCDGNGDGIGDFRGIIQKLPYLEELGVGGIWLTPFYPSPKVDNGYDVSNYRAVAGEYGSMEDFSELIEKAHARGIRVIADVVVNHTSSAHPWFQEAIRNPSSPKRDFYIFHRTWEGKAGQPSGVPNNWESFFGGSAWELDEVSGSYYYHSFAKEQVDLNWANPLVEEAVYEILDFWIQKGIDGFRFDVINNLTLCGDLRDNPLDGQGRQIHRYDVNQPGIYEKISRLTHYLKEQGDLFLVGEVSSEELPLIHSYVGQAGLDTTFNFNLGSRERFEFASFFDEICKMNAWYGEDELPTLFFGSHDMGRFRSRFNLDENRVKCILTFILTGRGIPFLYYGDETGQENIVLHSIDEARDVQGIMAYERAKEEGKKEEEAIAILNQESRDKSRGAMIWAENQVLAYTKKLAGLRNREKAFSAGTCSYGSPDREVLSIQREYDGEVWQVWINFSDVPFLRREEGIVPVLLSWEGEAGSSGKFRIPPGGSAIFQKKAEF